MCHLYHFFTTASYNKVLCNPVCSNSQEIDQENEACTNDVKAKEKGKGDQYVDAEQKNKCKVYQSNYADQYADIYDYSYTDNFADIFQLK